MYILKQVLHETIWGGNRLNKYSKKGYDSLGHLYMINGHLNMSNEIVNGKYKGKTLYDIFPFEKNNWNMEKFDEFPLTIALVDASDNLSIQVHPADKVAEVLEGKKIGKTESWLFLEAPIKGWIYAGCSCDTKEQVKIAVKNNKMEEITERLALCKNDYVCVHAGTLHAMTTGSLVYEIEYGSDFTYRFFDYNRKDKNGNERELHINKALLAIDPNVKIKLKKNVKPDEWITEEYYEIKQIENKHFYKNDSKKVECISLIDGTIDTGECQINSGMSIILLPEEVLDNCNINKAIIARLT